MAVKYVRNSCFVPMQARILHLRLLYFLENEGMSIRRFFMVRHRVDFLGYGIQKV